MSSPRADLLSKARSPSPLLRPQSVCVCLPVVQLTANTPLSHPVDVGRGGYSPLRLSLLPRRCEAPCGQPNGRSLSPLSKQVHVTCSWRGTAGLSGRSLSLPHPTPHTPQRISLYLVQNNTHVNWPGLLLPEGAVSRGKQRRSFRCGGTAGGKWEVQQVNLLRSACNAVT